MTRGLRADAPTVEERFTLKFDIAETGCWLWNGPINNWGYGRFYCGQQKSMPAHRWVYENYVEPIPPKYEVDHICRVRHCVNPDHLEAVTKRENGLRGDSPSAKNARKTHCSKGHPFNQANTYIRKDGGGRMCRLCVNERSALAHRRHPRRRRSTAPPTHAAA